jgi:ABC-type nitrate/sulfonate/bicarbonate transport system ATPase subunit
MAQAIGSVSHQPPAIALQSVSKAYPGRPLFDRLSLRVPAGQVLGIFGPNGCGKSTLLYLISRTETPDAGQILVNAPDGPVRIGFVFQNSQESLFPWLTVRNNVLIASECARLEQARDTVDELLKTWELGHLAGANPLRLSGGEAQRLAFARALANSPDLLLLDEPFSSVDYVCRRRLLRTARGSGLLSCRTVLFVAHHIEDLLLLADRILVLSHQPRSGTSVVGDLAVPCSDDRFRLWESGGLQSVYQEVLSLSDLR